jgi:hypothetical protein
MAHGTGQVMPDGTSIKWNVERVYRTRPEQPMRAAGARWFAAVGAKPPVLMVEAGCTPPL